MDGSEDQELSIRDLPGMEIGDWEDDVLLLDLDKEEAAVDDDAEHCITMDLLACN